MLTVKDIFTMPLEKETTPVKTENKSSDSSDGFDPARIVESGGGGFGFGLVMPEIVQGVGYGMYASSALAPAAPLVIGAGRGMRGARLAEAATMGLGSMAGESSRQALDVMGAPKLAQQTVGMAAEMAGPQALVSASKYAPVVGKLIREDISKLTEKASDYFANKIRGTLSSTERKPQEEVINALNSEAKFYRDWGQSQANSIISEAEQKAKPLETVNQAEAQKIRERAKQEANFVMQSVDRKIAEAQTLRNRAFGAAGKAEDLPKQTILAIGQPKEPTAVGNELRDQILKSKGEEIAARDLQKKADLNLANTEIQTKLSQGVTPSTVKSYQEALRWLEGKLGTGEGKKLFPYDAETDPTVRSQLQVIYDSLSPRNVVTSDGLVKQGAPVYFNAFDTIRRRVGEAAYGSKQAAEGYAAIGEQNAKDLYTYLREAGREYSPAHGTFLDNYGTFAGELSKYGTKAGQKATAVDRFDKDRFTTYAADLPKTYFKNKESVEDLFELTNNNKQLVESAARSYVAKELQGKSFSATNQFAKDNSDWLQLFPDIKSSIESHTAALARAERVPERARALARGLGTDIKAIPGLAKKEASNIIKSGETEAGKLITGDSGVVSAKKAAANLLAENKAKAALFDSVDVDPVIAFDRLLASGNTERLKASAEVIQNSPELMSSFKQGVQLYVSRMNPKTMKDDFERVIKPALFDLGLMDFKELGYLSRQVQLVDVSANPRAIPNLIIKSIARIGAGEGTRPLNPLIEKGFIGAMNSF